MAKCLDHILAQPAACVVQPGREGNSPMDDRASLSTPIAQYTTPGRGTPWLDTWLGRDWKIAYFFVLPMLLLMVGLIFWPFVNAILLSTTALNFQTGDLVNVGLRNYQRLFTNSDYLLAMGNTINFTFWSLSIKFVTGMTIALILHSKMPWKDLLAAIMLLPWIVPEIVTAL